MRGFRYTQDRALWRLLVFNPDRDFRLRRGCGRGGLRYCRAYPQGRKHFIGPVNTFLRFSAVSTNRDNRFSLAISLSPDKSPKWRGILNQLGRERIATHSMLEIVIGEIDFAQNNVFPALCDARLCRSTGSCTRALITLAYTWGNLALPNGGRMF